MLKYKKKDTIKYDIIKMMGRYSYKGVLPAYSIWMLYDSKTSNYVANNYFISFDIFKQCFEELIKDKIVIVNNSSSKNSGLFRLADDFYHETDPIGRYKYIMDLLNESAK